ncbi:protein-methionine sulfoxide oxidase mical2b isoform X2 [Genypterus blacodes]|uniref:protein-methionine sulfoxide oxidase mical2b isoform X2 n=1 Tax=Genypterus blacodes TaxID=154954 RepID=UPI003F76C9F8
MAAVKALQQWCRARCEGYRDVNVTNMTTSFRDGLAFCALIHKHRPDLINFDSLKKENVYENNKLAFQVAEEELGIPALLDAEDMVAMKVPDRLSILTYVSQYYNYFHGRSPIGGMGGIKRPADGATDEPSGKKNQPVVAQKVPSSVPPSSTRITKPTSSPRQARKATQEVSVEKTQRTGTLSNKCVSCNEHVHLVQRHLVEGKLYHRNCAKLLSPSSTTLRVLPQYTPHPDTTKSRTDTPATQAQTKPGPAWLKEKSSTPASNPSSLSTSSPWQPAPRFSSPGRESRTAVIPKPSLTSETPRTTFSTTLTTTPNATRANASPRFTRNPVTTSAITSKRSVSPHATTDPVTTTASVTSRPTAAPRTSTTAAKTLQDKLKFFQAGSDSTSADEENKTATKNVDTSRWLSPKGQGQDAPACQSVTVVLNVGGKKDVSVSKITGKDEGKAADLRGTTGKVYTKEASCDKNKTKAEAAAFISKTLAEEDNNNTNKPTWTNVVLKTTDKSDDTQPKTTEGVRGRRKLKANPAILADLQNSPLVDTSSSALSPASRTGPGARSPDKRSPKPDYASPKTTGASERSSSPADWRSRLKPVSKETTPAAPSQWSSSNSKPTDASSNLWANGAGKSPAAEGTVGPSSSHLPSFSVTPPAPKDLWNGQSGKTTNSTKPESTVPKTKPDFIPKDDIIKELKQIEDNLNELEKRGVELEVKLRHSEEEGEDDSVMNELMVEWFNLIRNKQLAMRRESELVYVGRTQDLEEQQPSVEQELRTLIDKPDHLKSSWERRKEEELMTKLVEIVNDRNAIIDGLDEDRLREEEEDVELDKMMMTFNIKKDKPKKKSKLFSWGNKKEG